MDISVEPASSAFRIESNFYEHAAALRMQLEERLSLCASNDAGVTPLRYVFSNNRYRFLTASAEHILTSESLQDLIEQLYVWGQHHLGIAHVSTPQFRAYIGGCSREVIQDDVKPGWHFMLSLTQGTAQAVTRIRVLLTGKERNGKNQLSVCDFVAVQPAFNRLLLHDSHDAYGVEPGQCSMNPLEGAIFLDGYLW